jgi:predicted AAA+ superfamily ATPase
MVRLLQPWQVNIGNRLIKQPQLYLRNSGLLHVLLAILPGRRAAGSDGPRR